MIYQKFSKHTGELLTELSCLCTGTRSNFLCGAAGDPCSGEGAAVTHGAACPPWPPGPQLSMCTWSWGTPLPAEAAASWSLCLPCSRGARAPWLCLKFDFTCFLHCW